VGGKVRIPKRNAGSYCCPVLFLPHDFSAGLFTAVSPVASEMHDELKTKIPLITELHELRERVAELEKDQDECRRVEEALRRSEHFVNRVIETTPYLFYICDLVEKRNIYANREIRTFRGYVLEQIQAMGGSLSQNLFHAKDIPSIEEHQKALAPAGEGDVRAVEYLVRHSSGEWRWLSAPPQNKVTIIPRRHFRMLLAGIQKESPDARLRGHDRAYVGHSFMWPCT
jgi:PAS domain-containing protein